MIIPVISDKAVHHNGIKPAPNGDHTASDMISPPLSPIGMAAAFCLPSFPHPVPLPERGSDNDRVAKEAPRIKFRPPALPQSQGSVYSGAD